MSTIDPSIPLGVRPVEIPNQLAQMGQLAQLQGAQTQNALLQLKMDEARRGIEDENALRAGLSAPGADPFQVLLGRGKVKEATEYAASQRAKEKDALEMNIKKLGLGAQILSTAKDQPSYDAARATAQANGLDVSAMPPQFDPNVVQTRLQQAMTIKDQAEERWKQLTHELDVQKFGETQRHDRTTEGLTQRGQDVSAQTARRGQDITLRGQNLTDARARETIAAGISKPFEVTGPDGTSILVQQDRAGNITPVQGYAPKGGGKPLPGAALKQITEVRDNANTIDRLAGSFKEDYAGKGVLGFGAEAQLGAAGVLGKDQDAVEWWKNYRKQAELVERHALFGAALTPGEQASWRSADIGPGMDPKTIKRNLATRKELATRVLEMARQDLIDAGHSEQRVNAIAGRGPAGSTGNTAPKSAPAAGTVQDGYRFKGGDPSKPQSWEKVR